MKLRINKPIIIAIVAFLLGVGLMYAYTRIEVQKNKEIARQTIKASLEGMEALQAISYSCSDAYNTVTNCISNIKSCDVTAETEKLDAFEKEKEQGLEKVNSSNRKMRTIIEDYWPNRK